MAVRGSCAARAAQAREAARAAAAKVAAVELRVGDGGRRERRAFARVGYPGRRQFRKNSRPSQAKQIAQASFMRSAGNSKQKREKRNRLELRTPTRPERLRVHSCISCIRTSARHRSSSATRYLSSSSSSRPPRSSTARAATYVEIRVAQTSASWLSGGLFLSAPDRAPGYP